MKYKFMVLAWFFVVAYPAQSFQWALQKHYSDQNRSESVGTDKWGNIYVTGRFIPAYNQNSHPSGCFFSKYNANGSLSWTDTVINVIDVRSVTDSIGNTYATGYFRNTFVFGNSTFYANGYTGGFLVKYNSNGERVWAKNVYGLGITITQQGGIYTTSIHTGTFIPNFGNLLNKFDTDGNLIWSKNVIIKNNNGAATATGVNADEYGNAYIAGQFQDTVTWGTGVNSITHIYNGPYRNNYVAKYDPSGNCKWVMVDSNPSYGFEFQFPFSISTDSSGNSIIAGTFFNVLTFGATTYSAGNNASIILAQYDPNGNLNWQKTIMGQSNIYAYAITQDKIQNFYITGYIDGQTNFGSGVTGGSNWDAYVVKYDKYINAQWLAYSTQVGNGGGANGYGLCTDNNNIYMVGAVSGSNVVFGSTTLSTPITYYSDMFLTKIKDNQVSTGFNVNAPSFKSELFSFYPNPTTDFLNIRSKDYTTDKTEIKISNVFGQCIFSKTCEISGAELNERIDLSHFPKGVYFIQISTGNATEVRKVVLE